MGKLQKPLKHKYEVEIDVMHRSTAIRKCAFEFLISVTFLFQSLDNKQASIFIYYVEPVQFKVNRKSTARKEKKTRAKKFSYFRQERTRERKSISFIIY